MMKTIKTFQEFYPFYLSQHQNITCRILHFIGTFLFFILLFWGVFNHWSWQFVSLPIVGYGFAWVGHFVFEKNKPATFTYPFWSLLSDFKLFFELLLRKEKF